MADDWEPPDPYGDAQDEATRIRFLADQAFEKAAAPHQAKLAKARAVFDKAMDPLEQAWRSEIDRAKVVEEQGFQTMWTMHQEHEKNFNQFVSGLLTAAAAGGEEAMKTFAMDYVEEDGTPKSLYPAPTP
jgi:hypothetical protein